MPEASKRGRGGRRGLDDGGRDWFDVSGIHLIDVIIVRVFGVVLQ